MISREKALALLRSSGVSKKVIGHCLAVEKKALELAKVNNADLDLVSIGAILHDIGRSKAQGISHGVIGGEIARSLGLDERIARIIERHVGSGITREEAVKLGLPERELMPKSLEEKIVNHADNLVDGNIVLSFEKALAEYSGKFGESSLIVARLKKLQSELGKRK